MYSAPYIFSENNPYHGKGIHLGVCGSIAAFRAVDLVRWWGKNALHTSVTLTDAAQRFITPLTFEALGALPIYTNMWEQERIFGHLEPGQNCHAMLIAPASASTLAQVTHGHAHTLLACQALAFDGPLLVAPAMNPRMWANAATKANVDTLRQRGIKVIVPEQGGTACGQEGQGRLADLRHIWLLSLKALTKQDMQGKHVLITLGPTREAWDAVRYWSNPSTGTMGMALAISAWLRGAKVHVVCGPITEGAGYLPKHPQIHRYDVLSAKEMYQAAADLWPRMDLGIFTAAVADYAPIPHAKGLHEKFKKDQAAEGFQINFTPNTDILRTLAQQKKSHQKILGFAAETAEDMPLAVQKKLHSKGADIIAGNNISRTDSGFGTATNAMFVMDTQGRSETWPTLAKTDVAWRLCSWLLNI